MGCGLSDVGQEESLRKQARETDPSNDAEKIRDEKA
jgi:hypothetical protein